MQHSLNCSLLFLCGSDNLDTKQVCTCEAWRLVILKVGRGSKKSFLSFGTILTEEVCTTSWLVYPTLTCKVGEYSGLCTELVLIFMMACCLLIFEYFWQAKCSLCFLWCTYSKVATGSSYILRKGYRHNNGTNLHDGKLIFILCRLEHQYSKVWRGQAAIPRIWMWAWPAQLYVTIVV